MDARQPRLFLGCRSKVMAVMNADTGQVIPTPVPAKCPDFPGPIAISLSRSTE